MLKIPCRFSSSPYLGQWNRFATTSAKTGKRTLAAEQHNTAQLMEAEVGLGRLRTWLAKGVSEFQMIGDVSSRLVIITLTPCCSLLGWTWRAVKAIIRGRKGRKGPYCYSGRVAETATNLFNIDRFSDGPERPKFYKERGQLPDMLQSWAKDTAVFLLV